MWKEVFGNFVTLWAVIDPIGTVPVFIAVTRKHSRNERTQIALRSALIAAGILLFFIIAGQLVLEAMGVPLPAFQVCGGVVLFLFALTMIFGDSKPEQEINLIKNKRDTAVFPLAVPSIASPGAMMAVVLLTDNHRFSIGSQAVTTLVMLVIVGVAMGLMLGASFIYRWIGETGASIISRVMGLILGAVAVNSVLEGIAVYFDVHS